MSDRDYSKDKKVLAHMTFQAAIEIATRGWIVSRETWKDMYLFFAKSGQFVAFDTTMGYLQPFMVKRHPDGTFSPYFPSDADRSAQDWQALTRQEEQAQHPERYRLDKGPLEGQIIEG